MLSACETGLGDVAGGEGVFGLQRAFHMAGTRNVVASLWKVDDQTTAALMTLFYRGLWQRQQSPIDCLRQAQLAIHFASDKIPEWSQGRGPNPKTVLDAKAVKRTANKKSVIKSWAAFVLSGPGD